MLCLSCITRQQLGARVLRGGSTPKPACEVALLGCQKRKHTFVPVVHTKPPRVKCNFDIHLLGYRQRHLEKVSSLVLTATNVSLDLVLVVCREWSVWKGSPAELLSSQEVFGNKGQATLECDSGASKRERETHSSWWDSSNRPGPNETLMFTCFDTDKSRHANEWRPSVATSNTPRPDLGRNIPKKKADQPKK